MSSPATSRTASSSDERVYLIEQVGDAAVVQVYADGFSSLSLYEKTLVWHLYQAALAGRDIFYDQRYAHNLVMREVLETLLRHPNGIDPGLLAEVRRYTKLFWINTGPYNYLTARKFVLQATPEALLSAMTAAADHGAGFPTRPGESLAALVARLSPLFFDPAVDPSVTSKTPGPGRDILASSANNLYEDVTIADLDGFEERYPLNSRLVKRDGQLVEEVYRTTGKYGEEIVRVVWHLEQALPYAPESMADALRALIRLYRSGEEADRERYDVAWLRDRDSPVDTINGFVEVYLDPRGVKGAWEALVYYVNREKTRQIELLAAHAQWFEDRMPWEPRFRKPEVRGVTARAIEVVVETGESGPVTPIGINLPNEQKIREAHGSKSVSLSNVLEAYDKATPKGLWAEFCWSADEATRARRWSALAGELTTDMHEVIGHGSGRMADKLGAPPQALLKEFYSALEESRADLVALYFVADPKLVELGLMAADDHDEIVTAEYESYSRNALTQLRRVKEGTQLEEDHMRNRQMIVHWLLAHTRAIDVRVRDGKTYYVLADKQAFREGAGHLLAEVQRIKATGDYDAARRLIETYGVHFDGVLRDEIVARTAALNLPSYTGFVMPRLDATYAPDGSITDVAISYPLDLETQMLEYSSMAPAERAARMTVAEPPPRIPVFEPHSTGRPA
jgi:dipeptidyl-peptidase-3